MVVVAGFELGIAVIAMAPPCYTRWMMFTQSIYFMQRKPTDLITKIVLTFFVTLRRAERKTKSVDTKAIIELGTTD